MEIKGGKIEFDNDWTEIKTGFCTNLFSIGWCNKRQWAVNLLGLTYYKKDPDRCDDDCRTIFFHILDCHFYGLRKKYYDNEGMFSISLFGFGIIVTWVIK